MRPELFIGKYGVGIIFLLSGLSLQTSELTEAVSNIKLNGLIGLVIFGLWPFIIGLPLKYLLTNVFPNLIPPALVDGLLIMTCLPTTVNMCIMLTSAAGGNVATSICNAVLTNLAGPYDCIPDLSKETLLSILVGCVFPIPKAFVFLFFIRDFPDPRSSSSILRGSYKTSICRHGDEAMQNSVASGR